MPLSVITPSTNLALDLDKLKKHLRLVVNEADEFTADDDLLTDMIKAATGAYQDKFKTTLLDTVYEYEFIGFRRELELPRPPLSAVGSVIYIDDNGDEVTVDSEMYTINKPDSYAGSVLFHSDFEYPELSSTAIFPVKIRFTAGYGSTIDKIPAEIRLYLSNIVGTYYMQRESVLVSYSGNISVEDMTRSMAGLIAGKPKAMRFG